MAPLASQIVIAKVVDLGPIPATQSENQNAILEPQVFLKGAASSQPLRFTRSGPLHPCQHAEWMVGQRVLVFVLGDEEPFAWPGAEAALALADGHAKSFNPADANDYLESDLVTTIRSITNQYAVPAASSAEGAGIDWGKTVLPLSAALGAVFIIGLFLMRIWHRIDPS